MIYAKISVYSEDRTQRIILETFLKDDNFEDDSEKTEFESMREVYCYLAGQGFIPISETFFYKP